MGVVTAKRVCAIQNSPFSLCKSQELSKLRDLGLRFSGRHFIELVQIGTAMETPCIKVCVIDEASGLCSGCHRSRAEIAAWSSIGADSRRRIMAELPNRLLARRAGERR